MIYAKVSPEDQVLIDQELKTTRDAKWYRRLKIIQLSGQGKTVPQLAELFDVCKATVRDYLHRYNQGGLSALRRRFSPGAPLKIPLSKAQWEEVLHRSPSQFPELETNARNWTQELLVEYVAQVHGIAVAQSTLSLLLKRLGIRWNRGKLKVTSPDPLYTVKRERIETLKKKPGRDP